MEFCQQKKSYVTSQYLDFKRRFSKINMPTVHDATKHKITSK